LDLSMISHPLMTHAIVFNVCWYIMRATEPATQYVVSVRAFNDVDKGPVIYDLVYTASAQGGTSSLQGRI